jgi:tetratricopeptide (TPR) repeat protein
MRPTLPLLAALLALGCVEQPTAPPAAAPPAGPVTAGEAGQPAHAPGPLRFIEDDLPAAAARARAEGKVLFVDAWAPWCHTCLSMKHFVLGDPALRGLEDRVIFAAVDTDRPSSAAFLERHAVTAWPTFFVIDPASDKVVGLWVGSGSLGEIRGLIEEGLGNLRGGAADPASRALSEARVAHAAGDLPAAAAGYERAIAAAPPSWPGRSAALVGWIEVLAGSKQWARCVSVGQAHLGAVRGSSAPGDFAATLLSCAGKLPAGAEQIAARTLAVDRLRELTAHPPADASVDDRQDALDTLAGGLDDLGDPAGAKKAQEARLALLEQAARAARTPEMAQTFDYARANAYVALGRGDEAVAMLTRRERELPDSYEPPARLAGVLLKSGRLPEALAAIDRALARAYGPRRVRYLELRADILGKSGDRAGALAALRDAVKGYEALPPGQASPAKLAEARRRLEEAEKKGAP